jgi:hypothetical protein
MTSHYPYLASHYPYLAELCERIGVPAVFPEPETLRADLARIQAKTLAGVIADLLNENEPLLKAEADGSTVTVRGALAATMTVTISGGGVSAQAAPSDE